MSGARVARRGRLSVRIGGAILGLVLFVTLVQGVALALVFFVQVVPVRERLADEGLALARLAVLRGVDADTLHRELASVPHLRLGIYDAAGARLAASHDDARIRERLDPALMAQATSRHGEPFYTTRLGPGQPTDFVVAVEGANGARFLSFYEDSAQRAFPSARWRLLAGALAVAMLVSLLITWAIARRVRTSIQTTERAVRRMAAGDLSARLEDAGDDELGRLVQDFNEMAEKLAQHVTRLEGEEERRRGLFAAFTHEINTPLTAVLGYLESLRMPQVDEDPETRRKYVSVAFDQAQKLDALADDLTTLSKLDYDGIALDREPSDLARIVTDEIAGLTPRADARKITLRVEGDGARCDVDRARIGQVVRNLIDNAIRYGTAGTDVVARVEVAEETVSFSIVDRGEGIAAEHLPLLGTPLYRVDSSRARTGPGGRGLGLAIARGLVKAHGGTLEVASTRDVGTTVRVTLPRTAQGPIA